MISRSQDVNINSNELETIHHSSSKGQENKIIENGQPEVETAMWIQKSDRLIYANLLVQMFFDYVWYTLLVNIFEHGQKLDFTW